MSEVVINPMRETIRAIPAHWRPYPPPIFIGTNPTPADYALALDLWRALDIESRRWYFPAVASLGLTPADISALDLS